MAEDQKWFDKRWQYFTDEDGVLGRFGDVNVFVSYEPALGGLVLPESFYPDMTAFCSDNSGTNYLHKGNRWLIAGGESGTKARPPKPYWFINIMKQCKDNGVMAFFKQWGAFRPTTNPTGTIPMYNGWWDNMEAQGRFMKKAPKATGNDLLFGQAFKDTPLNGGS